MLFGVRTERKSINTSKYTAVQQSSYPLALAQRKPDFDLHDGHSTKSNISSLRMREPSPLVFLLQIARSHCTYLQRETGILLCNPKTDPKQQKLGGSPRHRNFNTSLLVIHNNLLQMYFVILIPPLARVAILRKSLRVSITCKITPFAHLLFQLFERAANVLAHVTF